MAISQEYKDMMTARHKRSATWGGSVVRYGLDDITSMIDRYEGQIYTVLDYGAGKGDLKRALIEVYGHDHLDITEYEPGVPGKDTLPSGRYDLVVTCDVLEHVEPDMIIPTMRELDKLTKAWGYHNIACSPTGGYFDSGTYKGLPTHISLHTPEHWLKIFEHHMGLTTVEYRHIERRSGKEMRTRCTLIVERTNG